MAPLPQLRERSPLASLQFAAALFKDSLKSPEGLKLGWSQVEPAFTSPRSSEPEEQRQWERFELADLLEQGMGPGCSHQFVEPLRDPSKEQRLIVRIEQAGDHYVLETPDGEELLTADSITGDNERFDIFIPCSASMAPAFRLEFSDEEEEWTLTSLRCEQCEAMGKRSVGTRELCRMVQYTEHIQDRQAFCMDVELPRMMEDGSPSIQCGICGVPSTEERLIDELTSVRPRYSKSRRRLVMGFGGRVTMSSVRNFILEDMEGEGDRKLLFGKIAANKFVLDFRRPLGTVQAFATALSTADWR